MVSVAKTIGIMTAAGAVLGGGTSYIMQNKIDNFTLRQARSIAKNGEIPIGGRTPDGKLWDGKISVDEFELNLRRKRTFSSVLMGLVSAVAMAAISGATLLIRGKVKVK